LHFNPSPIEVHRFVSEWFDDAEIFSFIGEHFHLIPDLSIRLYDNAKALKRDWPDWRRQLLQLAILDPKLRELARIRLDSTLGSEEERAKRFEALGHGKRATYFRWKHKLATAGHSAAAAEIRLKHGHQEAAPEPVF